MYSTQTGYSYEELMDRYIMNNLTLMGGWTDQGYSICLQFKGTTIGIVDLAKDNPHTI